jgi:acyl-coenzyme A synthetase/AMP-(fatty) acid ligase
MTPLLQDCLENRDLSLPCLYNAEGDLLHTYGSLLQAVEKEIETLKGPPCAGSILTLPSTNDTLFLIRALAAFEQGYSVLPAHEKPGPFSSAGLPEPCFLRWTSGSIAAPKLAAIPVSAIRKRIESARLAMPLQSSDCVLWFMPMADHFLVSILLYLSVGASMVLVEQPDRPLSRPLEQVTTLYGLPHPLIEFLHSNEDCDRLPGVRRVFAGGEAIPAYLNQLLQDRFQLACTPFWGLIEVGVPAIGEASASLHPGCVGTTVDGYRIERRERNSLPELEVQGPGLFAGYLERDRFIPRPDGPFPTGDIGTQDENGQWILQGRRRQSFEWNGRPWMAQELEALVLQHPDVIACRLCLNQLPKVRLEYQSSCPLDAASLESHCREITPLSLDGAEFIPVSSIPRTRTAKVDRLS